MNRTTEYTILSLIFFFTLAVRLYFALQFPFYHTDGSFFHHRQIEAIKETGYPIFSDELSYGGRTIIFSPIFDYIFAALSFMFELKIVENIFASSLVIFIYFIVKYLTNNAFSALFASFSSGFIPIFFKSTVNSLTPLALIAPLFVFLIHCFFKISDHKWLSFYVVYFIFLSFLHPLFIVFVLGVIFYLIFLLISQASVSKAEVEVCLFSLFFNVWAQFLLYKKVFLAHSLGFVWQNIPKELLSRFFSQITIFDVFINIGIFVFFTGLYILFTHIFNQNNKQFLFIASLICSVTVLLMLRLIQLSAGLSFLGIFFILLFADWLSRFYSYIKITKLASFHNWLSMGILGLLILSSLLPSTIGIKHAETDLFEALFWLKENTQSNSVIAADIDEGHMISAIAKRKNVADSFFLLQTDVEKRIKDIEALFSSRLNTEAVEIAEKYNITHILLSLKSQKKYVIKKLDYADGGCFKEIFKNQDSIIYEKRASCKLRVVE